MARKYDVIIIGSGPNGLIAGAYLSKAGLKTLVVESKLEMGGGLATEMVTMGGVYHNTHAIYMPMVDYAPPYKDFKLEEENRIRHIYPEVQFTLPLKDSNRSISIYNDTERTCESLAKISKKDADTYRKISKRFKEYMDQFIGPATYFPASPALDALAKMESTEIGRELGTYTPKSPLAICNELFESDPVRMLFLYVSCMWGLAPEGEGTGFLVPLYINRAANYRMCAGGTHTLAQAFYQIIYENGGEVIGNYPVVRIVVEGGKAKGVEVLEVGKKNEIIEADKAVISTLNPQQTFSELIGEDHFDKEFVEKLKMWEWEAWSFFSIYFVLSELPDFKAAKEEPQVNKSLIHVLGYENPKEFVAHYNAIKGGVVKEDAGFNCCFPSLHDPGMVKAAVNPKGKYTGLIAQMAPYELKQGGDERWYKREFQEEMAKGCFDALQRYAPNITKDKILDSRISTPKGVADKFPDMARGSFKQGAYTPFQLGYMRPNEECSNHRTPIERLYLGGASTYSGGTVIMGPGYLTAGAVAEDLGIKKWWKEPEMITKARNAGII
ncbi:MAG: NAD(P)/FAD-dependent oxidoreductase [Syntrophales bacterium]|nr:NAD(P)/FAD-dependent oxidoreductase [Syntrophales bacterium]